MMAGPRTHPLDAPPLGAIRRAEGVEVRVYAPAKARAVLALDGGAHEMQVDAHGYWTAFVPGAGVGSRYGIHLADTPEGALGPPFPDPCSRSQPDGVHGLSEVVDPDAFAWTDAAWSGVPLERYVCYELHVGTFTPEGTFAAASERLPYLRDLGVTAVELMPLHAFPGAFNWGYDPGAFWATPDAYGTPDDLRRLVDRAHALGLSVIVDVVLNHLGPDGAYVNAFAPMLVPAETPWGAAVNLEDAGVRRFLLETALLWLREYHADALRLDATSRLLDPGTPHLLAELSEAAATLAGPRRRLIAEDLRNRAIVTRPRAAGGYGMDSQWVDDLHGQVRALATPGEAYWAHYAGATANELAETLARGWTHAGEVARKQDDLVGSPPEGPLTRVTHYLDDHDLTGNRPHGDRLSATISPDLYRALSAMLLFAPAVPLLWMGQEWAASTPFPFFADHAPGLAQDVRTGRQRELDLWWTYAGTPPSPDAPATFASARLHWDEADTPPHAAVRRLYRTLLHLRPALPPAFTVQALSAEALLLQRGDWTLCVALCDGVALPTFDRPALLNTRHAAWGGSDEVRAADDVHAARAVLYGPSGASLPG